MATMIVRRVFGRAKDQEKIEKFVNWFTENLDKLETAVDEKNPSNGQFLLDYQPKTNSFIVEIQTAIEEFAEECFAKIKELEFDDFTMIGDVKNVTVREVN